MILADAYALVAFSLLGWIVNAVTYIGIVFERNRTWNKIAFILVFVPWSLTTLHVPSALWWFGSVCWAALRDEFNTVFRTKE